MAHTVSRLSAALSWQSKAKRSKELEYANLYPSMLHSVLQSANRRFFKWQMIPTPSDFRRTFSVRPDTVLSAHLVSWSMGHCPDHEYLAREGYQPTAARISLGTTLDGDKVPEAASNAILGETAIVSRPVPTTEASDRSTERIQAAEGVSQLMPEIARLAGELDSEFSRICPNANSEATSLQTGTPLHDAMLALHASLFKVNHMLDTADLNPALLLSQAQVILDGASTQVSEAISSPLLETIQGKPRPRLSAIRWILD